MNLKASHLIGIALFLLVIGYFADLNGLSLRAEEPRRAVVAMETLIGDSYIVPTIHDEPYYNKPPVFNWVLSSFYLLFGSMSEWVVRLPGVISVWLTALLVFFAARKNLGEEKAGLGALIYLTSADLLYYGAVNAGEIDLFYSMIIVAQALSIYYFFQRKKWLLLFLVSYVLTAVGFLTKGLPSLAFQALTLLGLFLYYRKFWKLFSWQHIFGIGLFASLVGGYFYLYNQENDALAFAVNLYKESSQRSANEASPWPVLLNIPKFPLLLAQLILPWSLFVFLIFGRGTGIKGNPFLRFSVIFILANIWLYWLSPDIRNRYLYMFFPFIAVILAHFYVRCLDPERNPPRWVLWLFRGATLIAAAFFVAVPLIGKFSAHLTYPWLICLPFVIGIVASVWIQFKRPSLAIYAFVACMAMVRIGYNKAIMPQVHAGSKGVYYAKNMDKMIEITGGEQIRYAGDPFIFQPEIKLLGNDLYTEKLKTPPLLAYEIPYYYTLKSNHLLLYDSVLKPDTYYLSARSFAEAHNANIKTGFRDKWIDQDLVLFRTAP